MNRMGTAKRSLIGITVLMAAGCGDATGPDGGAVVGEGSVPERFTSDLWVHGSFAYTGTWGRRTSGAWTRSGNTLKVWDVSSPSNPTLVSEVTVDASTVNDVKVSEDGSYAVITHEGASDGLNGITLLDLSSPGDPQPIRRFTDGLESGVHNVWIDHPYVYAAVDGVGQGLRIVDVSDPANPTLAGSFYAGSSILHDVYVRNGLAFLSHWDAGLVILDVGNGMAGGSPASPVEVSRVVTSGGQVHNAWYWPGGDYVFVGEEDFGTPGVVHVVDVSDMMAPVEVATFSVPGSPPHNFWLDEANAILYAAWYGRGVRAIDVSGQLSGALDQQGRELGRSLYAGISSGSCAGTDATCSWAPQLVDGLVYVSDMNLGLVILDPTLWTFGR